MEKAMIERIMEMIQSNETLKEQYKTNPDETINLMRLWLDAEEKGEDLDPFFSRRQAMDFGIQNLKQQLEAYQSQGKIAEAELIAEEIAIKSKMLPLIGKETEHPEEIREITEMEERLNEKKAAYKRALIGEAKQEGYTL